MYLFYKEEDIVKEIITPTIRLRLLSNSIVHYSFLQNVVIDLEDHKFNHNSLISITSLERHPMLIDGNEFMNITPDARKFIKSIEPHAPILARAFVVNSLSHRLMLLSYTKIKKSMYPLKIFKNHSEAQDWLLLILNNHNK